MSSTSKWKPLGWSVISESATILSHRRSELARGILIPLLALMGLHLYFLRPQTLLSRSSLLLFALLYAFLLVPILVAVYRTTLQDRKESDGWVLVPIWTMSEFRLFLPLVGVVLGAWVVVMAMGRLLFQMLTSPHVMEQLFQRGPGAMWWFLPLQFTIYAATLYFIGRLCIAFPASAMRPDRGVAWAWDIARGRVGPILALSVPLTLLSPLLALAWRNDSVVGDALSTIAFAAWLVTQNVILAVAYGRLEEHQRRQAEEMSIFEGTVWERM